ncbi:hypothetical protein NTD84_10245 [Pseudomonas sp. 14P_8.1_Bac3]|uniref:hypothetical protein n=1 Tax=Pseudomonas sp. 14P_8.1_Bac3 TaxID=2971621 RepID=UPI0021C88AF3|nr:hypothetical protein [Pseudomonas sp. 14P_8.1_Bac3]MCU1760087.1 hypothetical protein [Pseudomonas sp. 14P_8.1_Bac3]
MESKKEKEPWNWSREVTSCTIAAIVFGLWYGWIPNPFRSSPDDAFRSYLVNTTYVKDPASAQLRAVKSKDNLNFCGQINAKDDFGAYTGWTTFYSSYTKSEKQLWVFFDRFNAPDRVAEIPQVREVMKRCGM